MATVSETYQTEGPFFDTDFATTKYGLARISQFVSHRRSLDCWPTIEFLGHRSFESDIGWDPELFLEKKCQFFRVHSVGFISVFNSGSHFVLYAISRTSRQIYQYATHGMTHSLFATLCLSSITDLMQNQLLVNETIAVILWLVASFLIIFVSCDGSGPKVAYIIAGVCLEVYCQR